MLDGKKMLLVGGNFAEDVRPSGFVNKLKEYIEQEVQGSCTLDTKNGGTYEELKLIVDSVKTYDIVLWFANVPNTYDKIVADIKTINNKVILVNSKNNLNNKYSYHEMTSRMLDVKANLCMVFTKGYGPVETTIMDPLMNGYCDKEPDIKKVVSILISRLDKLINYTRAGSTSVGDAAEALDDKRFFEIANSKAAVFHNLIHAHDTSRFLGNLSFRCENGFPSYKNGDMIFVSRRNIDKRSINKDGFVGVLLSQGPGGAVSYLGEVKPSVDTPVQVALYNAYPNIKYMMHSHVYVKGAATTDEKIPCGAMEEVDSIKKLLDCGIKEASINLLGHGSIVMADNLDYFDSVQYEARPVLEF
jgi:hypothetical protein